MPLPAVARRLAEHPQRSRMYLAVIFLASICLHPIVLAYSMDPLLVTFWRCTLGALLFVPIMFVRQPRFRSQISRRDFGYMASAGVALTIHFIGLMEGLYRVSLGVSITVLSTSTIWVGVLSWLLLRRPLSPGQWAGMTVSLAGIVLFSLATASVSARSQSALLFLLLSALTGAWYFATAEKVRPRVATTTYVAIVFLVGAIASGGYALITSHPVRVQSLHDWLGILVITFIGQILVHTMSTLYLKDGNVVLLKLMGLIQIPIIAIIGWILFDQNLELAVVPALVLTIAGLILFTTARGRSQRDLRHSRV